MLIQGLQSNAKDHVKTRSTFSNAKDHVKTALVEFCKLCPVLPSLVTQFLPSLKVDLFYVNDKDHINVIGI